VSPTPRARFKRRFVGIRPWVRHSLVLMVAGCAYMTIGASYLLSQPTDSRSVALQVAFNVAPVEFWGTVFVLCGGLSVISSRWPPVTETWGYIVLTSLSAGWSATYLLGVVIEDAPNSNLSSAVVWALLAFIWYAVSGLVNPGQAVVVIEPHLDDELNEKGD